MKKSIRIIVVLLGLALCLTTIGGAVNPLSYPKFKAWNPATGTPLVSGKLYSYSPGTETPKNTYSDSGLTTANANPIILDSYGEASVYLSGSTKLILKTSADVSVWTIDSVTTPNDYFIDAAAYGSNQAGIEAAITAIGANNRTLNLSPATWSITGDLIIPSNIALRMDKGAVLAVATTKTLTINGPLEAGLYQVFSCTGTGKVTGLKKACPEWFGSLNDGTGAVVTTDGITAALASLSVGGKISFMPGGIYQLIDLVGTGRQTAFTVTTDKLIFEGNGATIRPGDSSDALGLSTYIFQVNSDDVTFKDLLFDGVGFVTPGAEGYHHSIHTGAAITGLNVIDCKFYDYPFYHIPIAIWGSSCIVDRCYFIRTCGGVMMVGNYNTTSNSYAVDWNDCPFIVTTGTGSRMIGNTAVSTLDVHYPAFAVEEGASNWEVIGNYANSKCSKSFDAIFLATPVETEGGIIASNTFITQDTQYADELHNVTISKYYKNNIVSGNKIIGIPGQNGSSSALYIGISNSKVFGNYICSSGAHYSLVQIGAGVGTAKTLQFSNNDLVIGPTGSIGIGFWARTGFDNGESIVQLKDNRYKHVPYGIRTDPGVGPLGTDMISHIIEGESFEDVTNPLFGTRADYFFLTNKAYQWLYSIKEKCSVYGNEVPAVGIVPNTTWFIYDVIHKIVPTSGQPLGWVCSANGTFSSATDNTGDTDGSTAVITGMTDTSDFIYGGYVTVSAGFPSAAVPYRILSKTATSVTLDTNSTSAQSNVTVAHVAPTFVAMPNYL